MRIETNRLIIDNIVESDKNDYFLAISHDTKVLETFICNYEETLDGFDFSKYLNRQDIYAIRLKDNMKLIGIVTMFDVKEHSLEIGYGLSSKYWNMGYMSEAIKAFIDYLFTQGFDTIYASYFIGNNASKRVMEKCNMHYSHTIKDELTYHDKLQTLDYYVIKK